MVPRQFSASRIQRAWVAEDAMASKQTRCRFQFVVDTMDKADTNIVVCH